MALLRYEVVDVFTGRPFAGNPLAVVLDATGLSAGQRQRIAREFNLSETTFVLPPVAGGHYRVKIHTPAAELPFAGHPSVGTAVTLARRGEIPAGEVVQECGAGNLPVLVTGDRARLTGGTPTVGPELDPGPLLAAVGLGPADVAGVPPRPAGCGIDSTHLLVRPDALARIELDVTALRALGTTLSVSHWDTDRRRSRARVFAADLGVPEDPATGSAALAHGVFLVAAGLLPPDGEASYTVVQGVEMGRPSTLDCAVSATGGRAVRATVAGQVIPVASGEIVAPSG